MMWKLTVGVAAVVLGASVALTADSPPRERIRFDHGLHVVEAEMACIDCHVGMESLPPGGNSVLSHDACEACHDVEDDEACDACHAGAYPPIERPRIAELCRGFVHKAHLEAAVDCEACHGSIVEPGMPPIVPRMQDCQHCHLALSAALDCDACHGGLVMLPDDHRLATWAEDHGLEASFGTSRCVSCHAQASCDECHQGVLLDGSPHPPSWMFDHFVEAAFGQDCLVCHETRESCTSCHRAMVPPPHGFGTSYANTEDGGAHKEEAEAFPEACLSCHDLGGDDPTCARCH